MFTPRIALKWTLGLLALFALSVAVGGSGSPPSAAAPAPVPRYVGGPAGGLPAITPTPTVEPEYAILQYVKDNNPEWSCTGPLGAPGHRYLTDCNPFGYFSHPTDAYLDRYNTPAEAQAAWQNRRTTICPTYPICLDSTLGGYPAYEAGNTAYPYAHYEEYAWASNWLMGAVSSDDTHFRGALSVANAMMNAAVTLGYLPSGSVTPTNTPTATPTCPPAWQQVPSPNASTADNYLLGVSALAPDDVWAVGYYSNTVTQRYETLTEHWNGSMWNIVPSPNPAGWHNYLRAVAAVASNDVWAVGDARVYPGGGGGYLLTFHWDGTSWTAVPNPNPGYNYANGLSGVKALASNDVWATGFWRAYSFRPLLMHWDGSAWIHELDPGIQGGMGGISGVASNDLWAVGQELGDGSLVYHRDGTGWSRISSPDVGGLRGVSALAANDVWAVGQNGIIRWNGTSWITMTVPVGGLLSVDALAANDVWVVASTAVLHWDGAQWAVRSTVVGELPVAVDALADDDVWAVGSNVQGGVARTLVERYMQGSCNTTPTVTVTPSVEPEYAILQRVKDNNPTMNCTGPLGTPGHRRLEDCLGGIGHVGDAYVDRYASPTEAQAAWQNRRDTICPTYPLCIDAPYRGYAGYEAGNTAYPYAHHENYLWGNIWLMGAESTDDTHFVLSPPLAREIIDAAIELGYLGEGGPTPTVTTTSTATATHTSVPPPTCTVTFQDVPPDNTFYPFVRCLACRGIVSGYPCGGPGEPCDGGNHSYFRPNNYVTRGQLAKIVSESAGFDDEIPPSQWTFTDVPYGSTFWVWVERLANREVMAGYQCGIVPNEPCDGQNRPYFRPTTGATRGQLTKIVSNAAGFTDPIPLTQYTFTDVQSGSPFWWYVERLLLNRPGVMAGYPCGGPGEPCDTENRPYFRPNNLLTRGQSGKIVSSTFFPGCNP